MSDCSSLYIVQLTPPGRGAVATLLLEGPGAEAALQAWFQAKSGRPLAAYPLDRLVFGHFALPTDAESAPAPGEEVVIRRHSAESVEIHCHGGSAAVQGIEQSLVSAGAKVVSWQDWVRERPAGPIAAAAQIALASARTEPAARILLDQYQGALRRAIEAVQNTLNDQNGPAALEQLEALLAHARTGLHLVEPWQVVLAGPPNVGKSSLINALLGYQRAIVHATPGTTRDAVTATTAIEGWPVQLSDTAGLRESNEVIEQAGIAVARQRLAAADLVVLVFDRSEPWSSSQQQLLAAWPEAVVVHNKADLPSSANSARPAGLATSARLGQGIDALIRTIAGRLVPQPPPAGAAVPFTQEHVDSLRAAQTAIHKGDFPAARSALWALY